MSFTKDLTTDPRSGILWVYSVHGWAKDYVVIHRVDHAATSTRQTRRCPMTRVTVGYVRVSTEGQAEHGLGLDTQRARIQAYGQSQGWTLTTIYKDAAQSGADLKRDALLQLLAQVRAGQVERVVVYKLDRLSRRLLHLKQLVDDEFIPHHTALVSVTEPINTETPAGRLFFNLLGSFAEFEREVITERMDSGRRTRAAHGRKAQGYAPLGYVGIPKLDAQGKRNVEIAVDPDGAALVQRMFRDYLRYGSLGKLADTLNTEGILSPDGKSWTRATLRWMLTNRFYIGEVKYGAVVTKGTHPPLIARPRFGRVQAALRRNRRSPGRAA